MPRKKVSDDADTTDLADRLAGLDDDEQLVEEVTTTRAIGRRKRSEPPASAGGQSAEPSTQRSTPAVDDTTDDDVIVGEYIDADDLDTDDDDAPLFPEGTLGNLLTQSDDDRLRSTQCNIIVRRKADTPGETFRNPCIGGRKEQPIRNVDLTQTQDEIEEIVRNNYGGGHYFLQIQIGNSLHRSWNADLADPLHFRTPAAGTAGDPPANVAAPAPPQPAPPPADPVTAFLDGIVKQKQLKDALFGDEERRFKETIAELRAEIAENRSQPSEPKSERLSMLETALSVTDAGIRERLLTRIFPPDDEGSRHWAAELLDVAIQNSDKLLPLVGGLLGGLLGGNAGTAGAPPASLQPGNSSLDDLMRQPAPAIEPTPPRRGMFTPVVSEPPALDHPNRQTTPFGDPGAGGQSDGTSEPPEVSGGSAAQDITEQPPTDDSDAIVGEVVEDAPRRGRRAKQEAA